MKEDLPIEILEVYDTIEKLLSPDEMIINKNKQASNCILFMLKSLFDFNNVDIAIQTNIKHNT